MGDKLYFEEVDIGKIGALMEEIVFDQMQDFFHADKSYFENCSIHLGLMVDRSAFMPVTDQKDQLLFSGNDLKYECLENEERKITDFENLMREKLKKHMSDEDDAHYTFGYRQYYGSGHGVSGSDSETGLLNTHTIFWGIHSTPKKSCEAVNELVRGVLLIVLKQCFEDTEEIRTLNDRKNAIAWLKQCIENKNINLINIYVNLIKEIYQVDSKVCSKISMEPYEGRECRGRLLFVDRELYLNAIGNDTVIFEFEEDDFQRRKLSKVQSTRKFLEMCENNYLLVDKKNELLIGISDQMDETYGYIAIQFQGIANWEMEVHGETILYYERGDYYVKRASEVLSAKIDLKSYLNEEVAGHILNAVKKARHGALVIIAADAKYEAKRLAGVNRATKIRTLNIDNENSEKQISGMLNVDGAVLISDKGECEAFGVILDGKAVVKGLEERGSRYNSAMNYIGQEKRIAIIASEDQSKGIIIEYGENIEIVKEPCK